MACIARLTASGDSKRPAKSKCEMKKLKLTQIMCFSLHQTSQSQKTRPCDAENKNNSGFGCFALIACCKLLHLDVS